MAEKVIPVKFKEIDLTNLAIVKQYYKEERGLELKDSSTLKMLLADRASELRKGHNKNE